MHPTQNSALFQSLTPQEAQLTKGGSYGNCYPRPRPSCCYTPPRPSCCSSRPRPSCCSSSSGGSSTSTRSGINQMVDIDFVID